MTDRDRLSEPGTADNEALDAIERLREQGNREWLEANRDRFNRTFTKERVRDPENPRHFSLCG